MRTNNRNYTIRDSSYAKELIKLGFDKDRLTSPEGSERLFKYCTNHNMKFLKGSNGLLIHKDFDKYFTLTTSSKKWDELSGISNTDKCVIPLDHANLFRCKLDKSIYMLTSSPYGWLDYHIMDGLRKYEYDTWIINPSLLNYYGFVENTQVYHPLNLVNYMFTDSPQGKINEIASSIREGTGIQSLFVKICGGVQEFEVGIW